MKPGRIFFDISFTRTQAGTVGISRTVRRLFAELQRRGYDPTAVAFHSRGYRRAPPNEAAATGTPAPRNWLLRMVTGPLVRSVVSLTLSIPWSLLSRVWGVASTRVFNGMTPDAEPIAFAPGDTLMLCDASWNYQAWKPAAQARAQGAKVLVMVYDLIPLRHPEFCYRLTTLIFGHWLAKMMANCDAAICISKATEDDLRLWIAQQGLAAPALGYFHLGSDLRAQPDATARLQDFFADGARCFVTVGSIEPRKNHAQLLEAFEQLWAQGSSARLLIAGKPTIDCQAFVDRLRSHPEAGSRLLVLFDASDGEIRYAYTRCTALVFPSLAEGFGLPIVEARACGCRVIASDLGVFREFADEGVVYFRAGSVDALREAVRAEIERPAQATAPVPGLSWAESGAQFVDVSARLLGP